MADNANNPQKPSRPDRPEHDAARQAESSADRAARPDEPTPQKPAQPRRPAGRPADGAAPRNPSPAAPRKLRTASEASEDLPAGKPLPKARQSTSQSSLAGAAAGAPAQGAHKRAVPPRRSPVTLNELPDPAANSRTRDPHFTAIFISAIILSLLIHTAVVMAVFQRPIGAVSTEQLQRDVVVQMKRQPQQDMLIDPLALEGDAAGESAETEEQGPALEALSAALLDTPLEGDRGQTEPEAELAPELREVAEVRPDSPADFNDDLAMLPDAAVDALLAGPTIDLPTSMDAEPVDNEPVQPLTRAIESGGSGISLANDLLAGVGSPPAGGRAGSGGGGTAGDSGGAAATGGSGAGGPGISAHVRRIDDEPALAQPQRGIDQRQTPSAAETPAIDFMELALAGTTQLEVPISLDDDFDYQVTAWRTPRITRDGPPGYFRVDITPRRSLRKLKTVPKDVVIIIDTSGSIPQEWVHHISRGVSDALAALNEGDRFNIVLFNERPSFFSNEGVVPFNARTLSAAQRFVLDAESRGSTDINATLSRLLVRDAADDRVQNLILISDGRPTKGVMDTRELINLITRDNNLAASIYCVGIGSRQNRQLLEFLAYRNKGFCVYTDHRNDVQPAIRDLMSRLRYPILKQVSFSVAGVPKDAVFPQEVPNIHQGERLSLFGRFAGNGEFTMRLTGVNGEQPVEFTFTRDFLNAQPGESKLARDWAFWKLHHLYSEIIRQGETQAILEQIKQLREQYDLETLY